MQPAPTVPSGSRVATTARLLAAFKQQIADGTLKPGGRLPPERHLAERFQVNRGTLRQTLKALEGLGVLTQRVGDGTYLASDAGAVLDEPIEFLFLLDGISIEERYDARQIVEPELAARAAQCATTDHLAEMRAALTALERSRTLDDRREADLAFHEAIFRASGNRVCRLIFRVVHRSVSVEDMARLISLQEAVEVHRGIYEAIARREPEEARRRMAEHLECCAQTLADDGVPFRFRKRASRSRGPASGS